ncbi:hypothetical protein [Enterococcus avium]|uniref:Uncharacterized protein n=1 Tax=Enterococcus avium TaxID=33945 RepID=A0A437ULN0_ENTAV|nr:hypothetical protein [Enterococcus avium]RVU94542.1 hypothetical protein EK398_06620 [Enterococcus avium]
MEENITIEFVKEWIDKHNLTKGSFDRIMNDLIYNSGHNYIDNPSLRYWLIDNTYKFRDMLPVKLNDNQQIVLDWLKWSVKEQGNSPMDAVYLLVLGETLVSVSLAYIALTPDQQTQVLAAFSKEVAE